MPSTARATFTVLIVPNPVQFGGGGLPADRVGSPYSVDVSVNAGQGQPPYNFALAPGSSLPPGLSLSAAGVISGTPTTPQTAPYSFDIICTDSGA